MTTTTTTAESPAETSADTPLAVVIDLFGNAAVEPSPERPTAALPAPSPRPRRRRAIGDTSSACASCHPDARAAVRYDTCVVCSPPAAQPSVQIALG